MGPHKRLFVLERTFEHVASLKLNKLGSWITHKNKALNEAGKDGLKVLEDVKAAGGWTKETLAEQWELQKQEQLSARSWTSQNAAKGLTTLVDAQRTPEALAHSLDDLDHIISANELRQTLSDTQSSNISLILDQQHEAAEELRRHHEESISKLSALTADLGLLQIDTANRNITKTGQGILKLLVLARSIKSALWLKITWYQDEINPLRESRRGGGGTKCYLV
ncbi:hypothetical protein FRB97_002159, partial [Tulasnella sp. 331]